MHTSYRQVIVIIVGQHNSTYQDSDHTAHLEELGHHVTHNSENISESNLSHLVLDQKSESPKQIRTK